MFEDDELEFEDDEFQWDVRKAAENFRKHGVRFEDARKIFDDPWCIDIPDTYHSDEEDRFQSIGKVGKNYYTVVYTFQDNKRRLISAWISEGYEKDEYDYSPDHDLSHQEIRRYVHDIKRKRGRKK